MQITRFRRDGKDQVGVIENGIVRETRGDVFGKLAVGPEIGPVGEVELLAPVS